MSPTYGLTPVAFSSMASWMITCTLSGWRTSVNCTGPPMPPDSMARSPAPTMRSMRFWSKFTLFTRSRGICTPLLLEHALAEDHLVVGDDEVGAPPADEPTDEPDGRATDRDHREPGEEGDVPGGHDHDGQDESQDHRRCRAEEVEPVGFQVDLDDLVLAQELARIRHEQERRGEPGPVRDAPRRVAIRPSRARPGGRRRCRSGGRPRGSR